MSILSKEDQVIEAISFYRSMILDVVEIQIGDTPCWQSTRGKFLRALGDRGLEGRIREILNLPKREQLNHQSYFK